MEAPANSAFKAWVFDTPLPLTIGHIEAGLAVTAVGRKHRDAAGEGSGPLNVFNERPGSWGRPKPLGSPGMELKSVREPGGEVAVGVCAVGADKPTYGSVETDA